MKTLGLYIHIPYCTKKCNYCDFFSICPDDPDTISNYVKTTVSNLKLWKDKLNNYIVDTIYIGGGTPSLMSIYDIDFLLNSIFSMFTLADKTEITMEANPNSFIALDIKALVESGINRISMGLQSIKDNELKLLGRLHTAGDAQIAVEKIHNSGITNFSLDVMLGIPLQDKKSLAETLDFCINSDASHISTYMLKIEENTPFYKNKDKLTFADNDTVADMYELTCEKLKKNGYRHYEISNFCKDNHISKHNMKYWLLDDYLGLGPSAHSMINGERFYYPRDFQSFSQNKTIFESNGNTHEEYIMLSLRTDKGFNFNEFNKLYSGKITDLFLQKAKMLEASGYVNLSDNNMSLTEKGFLVSNAIISEVIDSLG